MHPRWRADTSVTTPSAHRPCRSRAPNHDGAVGACVLDAPPAVLAQRLEAGPLGPNHIILSAEVLAKNGLDRTYIDDAALGRGLGASRCASVRPRRRG
jgi:hypothetical protein